MDFLFQYQVSSKDVYYNEPIPFEYDELKITLYLHNKDWISKGHKIHFEVTATTKEEAYQIIIKNILDFNNRLIFLTGESIIITHLEFILFDQEGKEARDIFFRDIKLPGVHELPFSIIEMDKNFFLTDINEIDKSAMAYYNQAIISDLSTEQFRTLYLSLERLAESEIVEAKCGSQNCKGVLVCPVCSKTKEYPQVSAANLQKFIDNSKYEEIIPDKISGRELVSLRGRFSHPSLPSKKKKAKDLTDTVGSLSLLLRKHLEDKFALKSFRGSIVKHGSVAGIDKKFITQHPDAKFALDIPSFSDFNNYNTDSRWIFKE